MALVIRFLNRKLSKNTYSVIRFMSIKKTIPADLMTGLEKRETILSETEEDPYGLSLKRGPGTRNEPNLVTSAFSKRMIGCICPDDDSLNINYMWLHMGEPKRCGCGFWFKLVAKDPV